MANKKTKKDKTANSEIKCPCCGKEKSEEEFYISYSEIFKGIGKIIVCKECIIQLFDYYNKKYKNEKSAIYRMCEFLDIYYDELLIESANKQAEKTNSNLMQIYMQKVNSLKQCKGKTFDDKKIKYVDAKEIKQDEEIKMTKKEEEAMKEVCRLLEYDPFIGYEKTDRKFLYSELIPYLDEDTLEDQYKISVIIQIVTNINQIRRFNLAINKMSIDIQGMINNGKEILNLTAITTKLNQQNDKLSKENNIALKHRAGSNSKNSTLGSMMKNLRELGLEKAEHDYYDMYKSYGIEKSIEISNKNIMEILHFDENDINTMFKMQREKIQQLQDTKMDLKEQIRLLAIENKEKENKIEELKKKK